MRQWRVGSFSMALTLILLGIVLVISQMNGISAVKMLINWWPAILILLGIEILLAGYFAKEEKPRIKYDFFAVIMVVFIGTVSLGIYFVSSIGIMDVISRASAITEYSVGLPEMKVQIPDGVTKLVVTGGQRKVNIRSIANAKDIVFFGQAKVLAASEKEANQLGSQQGINSRRVGNTLFVELKDFPVKRGFLHDGVAVHGNLDVLVIPNDIDLEYKSNSNYAELEVAMDSLNAGWWINNNGTIEISLAEKPNLKIHAISKVNLDGNVNWLLEKEESPDQVKDTLHQEKVSGELIYGEGANLLEVFSNERITVNVRSN